MSLSVDAASSQSMYNLNTALPGSTMYPSTAACWFNMAAPSGGGVQTIFAFSAPSAASSYTTVEVTNAAVLRTGTNAGTTAQNASLATALSAGVWYFVMIRCLSATNRWISVLHTNTGLVESAQNTTSRGSTGQTCASLGAVRTSDTQSLFMTGYIAEFWYQPFDCQPDGLTTNTDIVRQLAYGGPFSHTDVGPNVLAYRSLRCGTTSDENIVNETYIGNAEGVQAWIDAGGVQLGPHPPLPYWYDNRGDFDRMAMI